MEATLIIISKRQQIGQNILRICCLLTEMIEIRKPFLLTRGEKENLDDHHVPLNVAQSPLARQFTINLINLVIPWVRND